MGKELHLILTRHWYDDVKSGSKRVEYRDHTPYWRRRILENPSLEVVVFHRGYTRETLTFKISNYAVSKDTIQIHFE